MTERARTRTLAIVMILVLAAALGYAQARRGESISPLIVSGSDMGFRIEGRKGDAVVGRFVVRIDGRWVNVEYAFGPKPATAPH